MFSVNEPGILAFAASCLECRVSAVALSSIAGGDINQCYQARIQDGRCLFIKANAQGDILQSEFSALQKMGELGAEYYPKTVAFANTEGGGGLLAMDFITMQPLTEATAALAAQALCQQHQIHHTHFGWFENGHLGRSRQINEWEDQWATFFIERRLRPQLKQASEHGLDSRMIEGIKRLLDPFHDHLSDADIRPSLLHGDLWLGNLAFGIDESKQPVFYDPAPYFGDPESDIAMTMLFGRLPHGFYQQYRAMRPQPHDFHYRAAVYNLYHALNHVNLFGLSYERLVASLCEAALSAMGGD